MRLLGGVLIAFLTVQPVGAQFVPPIPQGLRGDTKVGDGSIPVPGTDQKWIRAVSPNFTIVSSASTERTREIATLLETVSGALRQVHPRFDARFTDTTVFVFSRRRDSQPYFDLLLNQKKTSASGAFVAQPDGTSAIIVDSGRTLATDRTVKHELMHNILASSGARLPLWLEEGIAEYFSTTEIRGDHVIVGRPVTSHQTHLRIRGTLPMEAVMDAKSGSPVATHVLFYPQVWAMVDWMMRANRSQFYDFVADVERGITSEEAFRSRYALDAAAVARTLRTAIARPNASATLEIERQPVAVSVEAISVPDALFELASFLGRMYRTRDDAEAYLRAALELDATHARATAGLGTLHAYQRRWDDAERFFDEAMKLNPDDHVVRLAYASALLRNAIGPFAGAVDLEGDAPARFARARELAFPVLGRDASGLADAIIGTTHLVEEDAAGGIAHLERARAARPARVDYAINLYALYLRTDRNDLAERLFESAFARSRNPQAAFAARAVHLRETLRKANKLVGQNRLDEAAVIVAELAARTEDASAKAELLKQVDDMRRVAESNRDVIEYNKAVTAFNRRENAAALQILETLIATATDAEIRNRAERLRARVKQRLEGM